MPSIYKKLITLISSFLESEINDKKEFDINLFYLLMIIMIVCVFFIFISFLNL